MTKLQSTSKGTMPRGVARRTYQGEVTGSSREETVCIDVKLSGCTNGAVVPTGENNCFASRRLWVQIPPVPLELDV